MNGKRPYMDYPQYRAARRLVHECCNYDNGNCILLDNGEPCVCVQSISYSLLCRWFIDDARTYGQPPKPGRQIARQHARGRRLHGIGSADNDKVKRQSENITTATP